MIKEKFKHYSVDQYGVKNYNSFYLLVFSVIILYGIIAILSVPLYQAELADPSSNIRSYKDAFWTLQMSASTIGFGDFYPVTLTGRIIVAAMFYIGVGLVGYIGAQFVNRFVSFSDTNVKNREIRKQNELIIEQNKQLEKKLEKLMTTINEKSQ